MINSKTGIKIFYIFFILSLFSCNSNNKKKLSEQSDSSMVLNDKEREHKEIEEQLKKIAFITYQTFFFGRYDNNELAFAYIPDEGDTLYALGKTFEYSIQDGHIIFHDNDRNIYYRMDFYDAEEGVNSPLNGYNKREAYPSEKNALLTITQGHLDEGSVEFSVLPEFIGHRRFLESDKEIELQNSFIRKYQETITKTKDLFQSTYKYFSGTKEEYNNQFLDSAKTFSRMQAGFDSLNVKYSTWINADKITVSLDSCRDPSFVTKVLMFKYDWESFYYKKYSIWSYDYGQRHQIHN